MSSQNVIVDAIENVNAVENVALDAEKQKKPTLAGKYSKLLNFGFWFSSMLESEELKTQLYNQLRLFGSIEEQTELFERFLAEEKEVAKTIRKCIAEHNKPPKPVKEKATKAPRKGKAVVHQDELISKLIADANADPIVDNSDEEADRLAKEEADRLAKEEADRLAKEEADRLAKEEADRLAKEAKEAAKLAEKEAARLAKEEADRLAKEAKEAARLAKDEEARLAKEEAARLAKEAKDLKEAEKIVAKLEKEAAAVLAKKAKAAEKQAKEDAVRLAKEAKEQEKANKAKSVKKTSTAKSVPVDVPPIANEVVEKTVEEVPIANEVIEKAVETLPITCMLKDELVAEVIEDESTYIPKPNESKIAQEPNANPILNELKIAEETDVNNQPNIAKKSNATKEPKVAKKSKEPKEPKAEKKPKKSVKPVEPIEPEEEEKEIDCRILPLEDKEYLIDQDNNIYDINPPNDLIGTYDYETHTILFY